jgi:hypothetical protein
MSHGGLAVTSRAEEILTHSPSREWKMATPGLGLLKAGNFTLETNKYSQDFQVSTLYFAMY